MNDSDDYLTRLSRERSQAFFESLCDDAVEEEDSGDESQGTAESVKERPGLDRRRTAQEVLLDLAIGREDVDCEVGDDAGEDGDGDEGGGEGDREDEEEEEEDEVMDEMDAALSEVRHRQRLVRVKRRRRMRLTGLFSSDVDDGEQAEPVPVALDRKTSNRQQSREDLLRMRNRRRRTLSSEEADKGEAVEEEADQGDSKKRKNKAAMLKRGVSFRDERLHDTHHYDPGDSADMKQQQQQHSERSSASSASSLFSYASGALSGALTPPMRPMRAVSDPQTIVKLRDTESGSTASLPLERPVMQRGVTAPPATGSRNRLSTSAERRALRRSVRFQCRNKRMSIGPRNFNTPRADSRRTTLRTPSDMSSSSSSSSSSSRARTMPSSPLNARVQPQEGVGDDGVDVRAFVPSAWTGPILHHSSVYRRSRRYERFHRKHRNSVVDDDGDSGDDDHDSDMSSQHEAEATTAPAILDESAKLSAERVREIRTALLTVHSPPKQRERKRDDGADDDSDDDGGALQKPPVMLRAVSDQSSVSGRSLHGSSSSLARGDDLERRFKKYLEALHVQSSHTSHTSAEDVALYRRHLPRWRTNRQFVDERLSSKEKMTKFDVCQLSTDTLRSLMLAAIENATRPQLVRLVLETQKHQWEEKWISCLGDKFWGAVFDYLDVQELLTTVLLVCQTWHDFVHSGSCVRSVDLFPLEDIVRDSHVIRLCPIWAQATEASLSACTNLTSRSIVYIAWHCPQLREVDLSFVPRLNDQALEALSKQCPNVESLNVSGCSRITDRGLGFVGRQLKHLHTLRLDNCQGIGDNGLAALSTHSLRVLSLILLTRVTDQGLRDVAQHCGATLTEVRLEMVDGITHLGIGYLARHCPMLQTIGLERERADTRIEDKAIVSLARYCHALRYLDLSRCSAVSDRGVAAIGDSCKELTSLFLSHCRLVTDVGVTAVANGCSRLESLSIAYCPQVTDAGMLAVATKCPLLVYLDIDGCMRVTDAAMTQLVERLDLCELFMRGLRGVGDKTAIAMAHHSNDVETLQIGYCAITDAGAVPLIAANEYIAELHLDGLSKVTDRTLTQISATCADTLETLHIGSCAVTDDGLSAVFSECSLSQLALTSLPNLTDVALMHMCESDSIESLSCLAIEDCPGVTIYALRVVLTECSSLGKLYLSRTLDLHLVRQLQREFPNRVLNGYYDFVARAWVTDVHRTPTLFLTN